MNASLNRFGICQQSPLKLNVLFKYLFIYLFIYFWLRWVFVAVCRLSLVAVSGGYSSLWCTGFSLWWLPLLWSTGSRCVGFSSCGTWAWQLWLVAQDSNPFKMSAHWTAMAVTRRLKPEPLKLYLDKNVARKPNPRTTITLTS